MDNNLSTRYYQNNKGRLHKRFAKSIKIFLKKKKTKSINMVAHGVKISPNLKNKDCLSKEKIILKCGKTIHNNQVIINFFSLEEIKFFQTSIRNFEAVLTLSKLICTVRYPAF